MNIPADRPKDKFLVREPCYRAGDRVGCRQPADGSPEHFDLLHRDIVASLQRAEMYVQDCSAAPIPRYRLPVRIITEYAWHSLFARNLLIVDPVQRRTPGRRQASRSSTRRTSRPIPRATGRGRKSSSPSVSRKRLVLIAGTSYAGEIKKSVFTILNGLLPLAGVLPMHCSANIGSAGDTALFFGLSGTGKTTLSSDADRALIGDDEHGWSDRGVFNFEGGCYAKTIRLSAEAEPQIYATTRRFGTVLENVALDPVTRRLDLDDDRLTENTRAAYPISFIENAQLVRAGRAPEERDHADRRCLRRAAADFAADARGRDLSLPLRLHRQGRRDREGRDGADGDVQHLFRRAVSAAGAEPLRHDARRAHPEARGAGLARQYGLDRRRVWHRPPHENLAHARDDSRRAGRRARRRHLRSRSGLQPRGADELPGRSRSKC